MNSFFVVNKLLTNKGIMLKGELGPNNKPLASWILIKLDFSLQQTAQIDESSILSLFVFTAFGFLLLAFFYTLIY